MGLLQGFFGAIGNWTWGWSLIPFLVVLGCFFTIATGFIQFRWFGRMWGVLKGHQAGAEGHVSSREALLVSVGGRVGGGNIAGVAVAITLGGPGAVFWMWAIALVGMCTSLVECSLAQLYKRNDVEGTYRGGPAQYIIHGLGGHFRWLAVIYAICLIAAFALGFNAFQGNTVAGAMQDSFGIERLWTGIALAALTGLIVYGGIKRIAKVADIVVPIMAIGYIALALIVILINIFELPGVIWTILTSAFGFNEAVAGGIGAAIANGVRRGLFSNEAGLGSAPNVAAVAYVHHPVSQGIVQSLSVFIDTMIICSATAFMILLGDVYAPGAEIDGVVLTQQSLVGHLGGLGPVLPVDGDPALRVLVDHLQLLPRRERLERVHQQRGGVPHAPHRDRRACVPWLRRPGCDGGVLLLGPDDGRPGDRQPARHRDAVPGRAKADPRLPGAVECGDRASCARRCGVERPRHRPDAWSDVGAPARAPADARPAPA